MPRTKVSKSSKRNREVANREEKIRDFDNSLDVFVNQLESMGQEHISGLMGEMRLLVQSTSSTVLQMKMEDFLDLKLDKFSDWTHSTSVAHAHGGNASQHQSMCNSATLLRSVKSSNPKDEGYLTEGYLTEDSTGDSSTNTATHAAYTNNSMSHLRTQQQQNQQRGRTPGPLSSARARRPRRSRSACGDYVVPGSALKPKNSAHVMRTPSAAADTRNKLRTPIASRQRALSADRANQLSPPTAFLRWPKPGELVVSTCGSPVVANIMPEKFANVNIPVKNGMLSLRPKKISELKPDFLENIDPETLDQIKTLHANLNLIMNMADKATLK